MSAPAPRISRIYETVLYGENLEAIAGFYRDVLGLAMTAPVGELARRFTMPDGSVLLIFDPRESSQPGREVPSHGSRGAGHIAFSIAADAFPLWGDRLRASGVEIEKVVLWPRGARSIYLRDPAGNSVELLDGEWPL